MGVDYLGPVMITGVLVFFIISVIITGLSYPYRTGANAFKLKEDRCRLDKRKKFFVIKTLEEVARRGDGCPVPGNIQSGYGWIGL